MSASCKLTRANRETKWCGWPAEPLPPSSQLSPPPWSRSWRVYHGCHRSRRSLANTTSPLPAAVHASPIKVTFGFMPPSLRFRYRHRRWLPLHPRRWSSPRFHTRTCYCFVLLHGVDVTVVVMRRICWIDVVLYPLSYASITLFFNLKYGYYFRRMILWLK